MNSRLLHLVRMGWLDSGVYSRLRSSAGRTPLLYGLPEVHKPSVPLRPIVSFVSSPTYCLLKFLADLLQPVVGRTGSHVKNSSDLVDFIKSQKLTREETMMSFDVVSLFTCVPTDLAVWVARCLDATISSFRGKVYKQVYGTAMGSPVSVVVANLVMEDVEERALESFHIALNASGSAMLTPLLHPSPRVSLPCSWTTSMALNHPSSSRQKRRGMESWCSWACYCTGKMMAQSALRSTARPHTPTNTCPSGPTIQRCTR